MRFLAAYVMKGRMQAILVTVVAAILSLLLPPLSYLSGAAVALVSLRLGFVQSAQVIAGATVATAVLAYPAMATPVPALVFLLALWLPVWVIALSLRRTMRLSRSLILAGLFGATLVLGIHAGTENPAAWWQEVFYEVMQTGVEQGAEPIPGLEQAIGEMAQLMTGMMAAGFAFSLIGCMLLGRWWQAILYNPGGFRQEFHTLRVGRLPAVTALILLLASQIDGAGLAGVAGDLAIVAATLFLLQGVAVVHGLVARTAVHSGWLVAMYVLLVLPVTMGQMAIVLIIAGMVDNWFDFRAFFGDKAQD